MGNLPAGFPLPFSNPPIAKAFLENGVRQAAAQLQVQILAESDCTLKGQLDRLLTGKLPDGKLLHMESVITRKRFFQVSVIVPPEEGTPAADHQQREVFVRKYLDSFKLQPAEGEPKPSKPDK